MSTYDSKKAVEAQRKYVEKNRDKVNAYRRKRYAQNKERLKAQKWQEPEKRKARSLKAKCGITLEQWHSLFVKQKGVCPVCGVILKQDKNTVVDHCRITGKVRGLLCRKCNSGIGLLQENAIILDRASKYVAGY